MRVCEACQREVVTTEHHLIPRSQHKRGLICRRFSKQEMRTRKAMLCPPCHRQVHRLFTERELALQYNTLEALVSTTEMQTFLGWMKKQRISTRTPDARFLRARVRISLAAARSRLHPGSRHRSPSIRKSLLPEASAGMEIRPARFQLLIKPEESILFQRGSESRTHL